jgi:hypothetical protein
MARVIHGKVAAIIDDTTLVLNVGADQGVEEGMAFVVYAEHDEVRDPDTGEALGRWEAVKARVVVTHVQPRLSTVRAPAEAPEPAPDGTRTLSAAMVEHSMGRYGAGSSPWQRLAVRAADVSGRPQTQPIAVGDGVRSVLTAPPLSAAPPPSGGTPHAPAST